MEAINLQQLGEIKIIKASKYGLTFEKWGHIWWLDFSNGNIFDETRVYKKDFPISRQIYPAITLEKFNLEFLSRLDPEITNQK